MTDVTAVAHLRCPAPLRDLPAWLCWKYEPNDNPGGKPRKVPYYAQGGRRHGQQGAPEDRAQLVTFDAARSAAARRKMAGVGFCTLPEFGIVALDFDGCLVDGEPHPDLLPILASTYAEYSPSGTGLRAFYQGQLGNLKQHGAPYGLELFSTRGYVTVTGNLLATTELLGHEDTIAALDDDALALIRARFSRAPGTEAITPSAVATPIGLTDGQLAEALDVLPTDLDYDSWLAVGMALHHERGEEGFELWDAWSQRSPKYTTREYSWDRWRSFGRSAGVPVTARSLVRLANEHGAHLILNGPATAEEFEAVAHTPSAPPDKPPRFTSIPVAEFASRAAPEWIVKGVLPRAELCVLFGESGSGKSFMALDLAMAIAQGLPWRSLRVKQGRVVYIAAEGAGGFRNRCQAYSEAHSLPLAGIALDVIADAPNLLLKDDALSIAQSIGRADVVIVDTFAQVTPGGNENAGEDVGKALAHCKGIHRATGALVILVHHSGKDASKGARGWSGLRAAADAELEVLRQPTGRFMRTSKQKDGADDLQWGFGLDIVTLGADNDGDPITSCVITEAPLPTSTLLRVLGAKETIVNDVIQDFAKAQSAGIEVKAVIERALAKLPAPEKGKRDTRKQMLTRAIKSLCTGDDAPYSLEDDDTTISVM